MIEPLSTALPDFGYLSNCNKKLKTVESPARYGRGLKVMRLHDCYVVAEPFLVEDFPENPDKNTFKVKNDIKDGAYLSRYLCVPGLEEFVFSRPTTTGMEGRLAPEDRGFGSYGNQIRKEKQMMQYELLVCLEHIRSGLVELSKSGSGCALTTFQLTVDWYNAWPFVRNEDRLGCLRQFFKCNVLDALRSADNMDGLCAATDCMEALGRLPTVRSLTLTYHYDIGLDFLARCPTMSNNLKEIDLWVTNKETTHPSRIARMLEATTTRLNDLSLGLQLEKLVVAVNSLDCANPLEWKSSNYYGNMRKLIFQSESTDDAFASSDFFLMPTSAPVPELQIPGREIPVVPVTQMADDHRDSKSLNMCLPKMFPCGLHMLCTNEQNMGQAARQREASWY